MISIEELSGATPVPVEDLVELPAQALSSVPAATSRNRAVTAAFQTDDPESAVQNYQTVMSENAMGSESTLQGLTSNIQAVNEEADFQGLMNILADPDAPIEQKESLIKDFKQSPWLKDINVSLADNALIADSPGMNDEQDMVRISTAETLGEYFQEVKKQQGLINSFRISNNEKQGVARTGEWVEMLLPGMDALAATKFESAFAEATGEQRGIWNSLKAAVLPGFSALAWREKFDTLGEAEKTQFIGKVLNVLQENTDLVAGDENQVNAIQLLDRYVAGDYTTTEAVVDSLFNVLDLVGLGFTAKSVVRGARGTKVAAKAASAAEDADVGIEAARKVQEDAAKAAPEGAAPPAAVMPEARVSTRASEIETLEAQHADLLSQVESRLDPGSVKNLNEELAAVNAQIREVTDSAIKEAARAAQGPGVSYKTALAEAKKLAADRKVELEGRKNAITSRLDKNARTAKAEGQLAGIEARLAKARKDTSTVPARLNPIMDSIHRIELNGNMSMDNPASAGAILSSMNPDKGRNLFKTIFQSTNDEVAMAAFGTTRTDAIVNQVFPQVATSSGAVRAKVPDIQRLLGEDIPLEEGGLRFTNKERDNMTAIVANDFRNARGLTIHDSESAFSVTPDGGYLKVSAMYGTKEGGFLRANEAVEQAKYALRDYGITDEAIVVMQKKGVDYVPVNLKDVQGIDGDFKIRIDTQIEQGMELMGDGWEHFDVKRNFFDRFTSTMWKGEGSLTRMLTDAASNLHPTISGSLSVATDVAVGLEKTLLKYADKFSDGFNKMPKARKNKVWEHLIEANDKGLPHDITQLTAKGFTPSEIDTMKQFRNFWDAHYYLENLDVVRTLRSQNYKVLNTNTGDQFFARPVVKNINNNKVYDPSDGTIKTLSRQEMDDLYDNGGTIGQLRRNVDINGEAVVHIIARNSPTEYLRSLNNSDKALNYREGYFQVTYKAPKFIREVNPDGSMRAVAVAGDMAKARLEAERMSRANGKQYKVTGDDRPIRRDSDEYWDINSSGGRIAQRHRGQQLEGADGVNHIDGASFIENPVDSAIRAARSIAGRTVTRPAIEAAKERAMQQYGHLLTKDEYGRPQYPSDVHNIVLKGEYTTKELADARTTFENINRFENGYINLIDESTKAILNSLANGIGELSVATGGKLGGLERAVQMTGDAKGVTAFARGVAFQAYIALNPIRNWIMQPAQVARTIGYNPVGWANGGIARLMIGQSKHIMGLKVDADILQMAKALDETGMLSAVDRSNLVRGAMMDAAGRGGNLAVRTGSKALEVSRTIGFDIGEKVNLLGHYAAVWEKYKRTGADLGDRRVLAQIHNEARAISGEMNKAGDLAYNQNSLAPIFQFAQVPHKFVLGMFNRKIDPWARARMAFGDVVLWGVPGTYAMSSLLGDDILPNDPELRDMVVSGMAAHILNDSLSYMLEDDTAIDLSSLAPYNLGGFSDLFKAAWSDGWAGVIDKSPAGQLLFKDTGRLGAAIGSLTRHFVPIEEGLSSPETVLDTINQFAKISSGWNNITKAYVAYATGLALDKNNIPTDTSVTAMEAIGMAFGMPTKTTAQHYETIGRLMDNKKANEDVAKQLVDSVFQMYSSAYQGESALDPEYTTRITGALLHVAQTNPALAREAYNQIKMRLKDPTTSTIANIMKAVGMPNLDNVEAITRDSAVPEQEKAKLLQLLSDVKAMSNKQKEN